MDRPPERVAVAVIRAWTESGEPGIVKIRITTEIDGMDERRTIGVASDITEACAIVRAWLEGFLGNRATGAGARAAGPRGGSS